MNILSVWIISILGVILLEITADLLLSGRLKNFCRSVFSSVAVLIIVMPIPTVIEKGCNDFDEIFDSTLSLDNSYIDSSSEYISDKMARGLEEALKADGISGIEIQIVLKEGKYDEIETVKIFIKNLVIENGMLHINKYDYLKEKVTEYLNVNEEMIWIYG